MQESTVVRGGIKEGSGNSGDSEINENLVQKTSDLIEIEYFHETHTCGVSRLEKFFVICTGLLHREPGFGGRGGSETMGSGIIQHMSQIEKALQEERQLDKALSNS